jgi:hypothetical protein
MAIVVAAGVSPADLSAQFPIAAVDSRRYTEEHKRDEFLLTALVRVLSRADWRRPNRP